MPSIANREAGIELLKALTSSVSAWVAASADKFPGILVCLGGNSTVSVICSALVLDMYILY